MVSAMLNPEINVDYDDIDLQHEISKDHWYVSGYRLSFNHPITEVHLPLMASHDPEQSMFRVVVKANLTQPMAMNLVSVIENALTSLDETWHERRKNKKVHKGHTAC